MCFLRFPATIYCGGRPFFRAFFLRLACPTIEGSEVLAEERSYAKDEKSVGTGVWLVLYLPTARIRPNPMQPRKHFDTGGLQELAGSIRQYGVLQPLTVRKAGGAYELVAESAACAAARLAGLTEVPCLLADVDEEAPGMLALVENLQRRDLDYIEEAEGLQKLMQQYHLSQEQAARRIGKSQSAVANKLRILRHPPSVLQALREHHLTERHARALLRLPDEEERLRVIGLIVQGEWTVAKTEQYIDARLAPKEPQRRELGIACPARRARVLELH